MDRRDISELYYIAPIANVSSILQYGILSNKRAKTLRHRSVAMPEIQVRRINKKIPGASHLHDYANLYFDAHNPMLSKVRQHNESICILRIDAGILNLPGVIIADRNASSNYVRFYTVTAGLAAIDKDALFARYWTHPDDQYAEMKHKSIKCAEVLVPDRVEPGCILGAYVANQSALTALRELGMALTVSIESDIFF